MATRAIIAKATAEGWEGRYSHWDNYPERMINVIGELVQRDGIEKVIHTLIDNTVSWSQVEPMATKGVPNLYEQHALVEGYGYAHTDIEPTEPPFTNKDTQLAWAEWLYILHDSMLEVHSVYTDENGKDATRFFWSSPWDSFTFINANA